MDHTLVLLLPLLQLLSVGTAAPLSGEVEDPKIKLRNKVKWMAELLLGRLNIKFQPPPGMAISPAAMHIDGPASAVSILKEYNNLISDSIPDVAQIKSDIKSLAGYLDQWRQSNCSEQLTKPPLPQWMQDLHGRKHFIHTVTNEVVLRLKAFLNLLLKNLEQFTTC